MCVHRATCLCIFRPPPSLTMATAAPAAAAAAMAPAAPVGSTGGAQPAAEKDPLSEVSEMCVKVLEEGK